MKKTLEDELMSLAHRILKLSGKEDLEQMKILTGELYEKLCVLSFAEKHSDELKPSFNYDDVAQILSQKEVNEEEKTTIANPKIDQPEEREVKNNLSLEEEIMDTSDKEDKKKDLVKNEIEEESDPFEEIEHTEEDSFEKISAEEDSSEEDFEEENFEEEVSMEDLVEEDISIKEVLSAEDSSEIDLREISVHYDDLPQFEPITPEETTPVEEKQKDLPEEKLEEKIEAVQPEPEEIIENPATHNPLADLFSTFGKSSRRNDTISHKRSLNQSLKLGLSFGLNDRIAFIKNLFENSEEDYNRVISQLNSFDKFSEARDFIEQQVKPDYNWENKEVYEERFFHVLEQRMEE